MDASKVWNLLFERRLVLDIQAHSVSCHIQLNDYVMEIYRKYVDLEKTHGMINSLHDQQ